MTSMRRIAFVLWLVAAVSMEACAPNRALTKDRLLGRETPQKQSGDEFVYTYEDADEASYESARKPGVSAIRPISKTDGEYGIREDERADTTPRKEKFFQPNGLMVREGISRTYDGLGREVRYEGFNRRPQDTSVRDDRRGQKSRQRRDGQRADQRRGPYKKNRILDLSSAAAKQLNMLPMARREWVSGFSGRVQTLKRRQDLKMRSSPFPAEKSTPEPMRSIVKMDGQGVMTLRGDTPFRPEPSILRKRLKT